MTTINNIDYESILAEAMIYQPILNIGMIGSVANGKSSITKALTGIATQKHSSEKQKNITIKLGYANAKIFKCLNCPRPECIQSGPSNLLNKKCSLCNSDMELVTHISIVDVPGHTRFMSTMINGTNVMDTTILVEAINNDNIPSPQTIEHLNAITVGNISNSIICVNKFDLVKTEIGIKRIKILKDNLDNTVAKDSPIIPISATFNINIDVLCDYISQIPTPIRDISVPHKMIVVRSFNINKPGTSIDEICGGVIGGSILCGKINVGMEVELRPGYCIENKNNDPVNIQYRWKYKPLRAKVLSINSENNNLNYAIPGGLIGVQLDIDPALTANDGLIGQILTPINNSYNVYEDIIISYKLLDESLFVKVNDLLQLNINACNVISRIEEKDDQGNILKLKLEKPISVNIKDKVTICYNGKIFGMGIIIEGKKSEEEL